MASFISCPVCWEEYKKDDEICTTDCGHVYHVQCMMTWRRYTVKCPQCCAYSPNAQKLFLNFEDPKPDLTNKVIELKEQIGDQNNELDVLTATISDLSLQLEEKDTKIRSLEQYIENQMQENSWIQNKMEESERNCIALIESLGKEHDQRNNSLQSNTESLKENLMREEIGILNQKLKQISNQFLKEMNLNTVLNIDIRRLSFVNTLLKSKYPEEECLNIELITENPIENQVKKDESFENVVKPVEKSTENCLVEMGPSSNVANASNKRSLYSILRRVVVTGIPNKPHSKDELYKIIQKISALMDIFVTENDIDDAYIMSRNYLSRLSKKNRKNAFAIQFKSVEMKEKFLQNAIKLKLYPITDKLDIIEYVSGKTFNLYCHAKKLMAINSKYYIYCKDNLVYIYEDGDTQSKLIKDSLHIDLLLEDEKSYVLPKKL